MYAHLRDEKLRELAQRPQDLTADARAALEAECKKRGLWPEEPTFEDPPLPPGATPCADHPTRAVAGVCRRCGRFICFRCDRAVGAQLKPLGANPPQGLCAACKERLGNGGQPRRIGGWLLLLAVGLVLSPISQTQAVWTTIAFLRETELSTAARALLVADTGLSLAFLVLTIYAASRFFGRRRDAPRWMMGLFAGALAQALLEQGFELLLEGEVEWGGSGVKGQLVGAALRAAIWIPYLQRSQRVKDTFLL